MIKAATARKNMLDCQLATSGIIDQDVLEVFAKVPREMFLPEDRRATAYLDEDIVLGDGIFCMEPVVHARMVQAARPRKTDAILNIGDMTGYSSAILSDLVLTVVTLEPRAGALDYARNVWDELNYCNIAAVRGKETQGSPEHAPYDIIFINGAVGAIPDNLLGQLGAGGRLVAVVRKPGDAGRITVVEKIGEGKYSSNIIGDAATPYVRGFEPVQTFIF